MTNNDYLVASEELIKIMGDVYARLWQLTEQHPASVAIKKDTPGSVNITMHITNSMFFAMASGVITKASALLEGHMNSSKN